MNAASNTSSQRALILAPMGRDAQIAASILREGGLIAEICNDLRRLVAEIYVGAGLAILTDDAVRHADLKALVGCIESQPSWSDFPFVLLTQRGGGVERNPDAARQMQTLGNVVFLERPFHPTTLVSVVRTALRGRQRQYEARAHLEALRAAHDTFRQLVDRSPFGIYAVNSDFRLVQVSAGAQKVFQNVRPLIGRDFAEVLRIIWPEPFSTEAIQRFRHTLETGEPYGAPRTVERRADIDIIEAYDWKIERLVLPDDRYGVVCHFYDLTDRQRYEDHIQLLMREVNHRSKNMLSVIQSIARQTAAASPSEFVQRFGERIQSLAASQDLLVKHEWTAVPLDELLYSQLSHFEDLIGSRICLSGPQLSVTPAASQVLAMAIHELATNAAKYGALSNKTGGIKISWSIESRRGEEPQFTLSWKEHGGPPLSKPQRHGFGSKVTSNAVKSALEADVTVDYAESGLVWSVKCPISKIIQGDIVFAKSADRSSLTESELNA